MAQATSRFDQAMTATENTQVDELRKRGRGNEFPSDRASFKEEVLPVVPEWEAGLCDCTYLGRCCCCLAFVPICGDRIVMARALSEMEGGDVFCFYLWCLRAPLARAYMREVYGIPGSVGWDCCLTYVCCSCVAAQMLSHVYIKGPADQMPAANEELTSNFVALPSDWKNCACFDPCNCLHTLCCLPCMSSAHLTAATGLPAWISCCYSCYCMNHHILRVNYGIPGTAHWNDCVEPCICASFLIPPLSPVAFLTYCYYTQMMQNERLAIKQASMRGLPRLLMKSAIGAATTEQPQRETATAFPVDVTSETTEEPAAPATGPTAREMVATMGPWVVSYGVVGALSAWFRSRG